MLRFRGRRTLAATSPPEQSPGSFPSFRQPEARTLPRSTATFFGSGPIDFTFAGNLKLSGGASIYSGALTVHSTSASVLDFVTASGVTGEFSGKITDDGALLHSGLGTTILSGTNSYPGTTTIAAGALQADIGVGIPTTSQVILDGGVLQSHAASSFTGNFVDAGGILRWGENGGGFSAGSSNMIVNIGGNTTAPDSRRMGFQPERRWIKTSRRPQAVFQLGSKRHDVSESYRPKRRDSHRASG